MAGAGTKGQVVGRIIGSHVLGLYVIGILSTIGTSAGFDVFSGGIILLIGGVASLPLIVPILLAAAHFAAWVDRHPLEFAGGGPLVVGAIVTLVMDYQAGKVVTACAGISSIFYLLMIAHGSWPARLGEDAESD